MYIEWCKNYNYCSELEDDAPDDDDDKEGWLTNGLLPILEPANNMASENEDIDQDNEVEDDGE